MAGRLDYRWHLREVMAGRGMFATTDLIGPLADREITCAQGIVATPDLTGRVLWFVGVVPGFRPSGSGCWWIIWRRG